MHKSRLVHSSVIFPFYFVKVWGKDLKHLKKKKKKKKKIPQ